MKNLLLAFAIAGLGLGVLTGVAQAGPQTQYTPKVKPYVQTQPYNPTLGFLGHMEFGGIRVLQVFWGTPASQMGLEPGDKIVQVNGDFIQSIPQYKYSLTKFNGFVYLLVKDINTGHLVPVYGYLPMNNGPVLYMKQGTAEKGPKILPGTIPQQKLNGEPQLNPKQPLKFQKKTTKPEFRKTPIFKSKEKGEEL